MIEKILEIKNIPRRFIVIPGEGLSHRAASHRRQPQLLSHPLHHPAGVFLGKRPLRSVPPRKKPGLRVFSLRINENFPLKILRDLENPAG